MLAEAGTTFIQVGGAPVRQSMRDDRKGQRVLLWTAVGAGVGYAWGHVLVANDDDCEPGASCDIVTPATTLLGALMGLLFGL